MINVNVRDQYGSTAASLTANPGHVNTFTVVVNGTSLVIEVNATSIIDNNTWQIRDAIDRLTEVLKLRVTAEHDIIFWKDLVGTLQLQLELLREKQ